MQTGAAEQGAPITTPLQGEGAITAQRVQETRSVSTAVIVRGQGYKRTPDGRAPKMTANAALALFRDASVRRLVDNPEVAGLGARGRGREAFGGEAPPQQFTDGRCAARHPFFEAKIIEHAQLLRREHDLKALIARSHPCFLVRHDACPVVDGQKLVLTDLLVNTVIVVKLGVLALWR